MTFIMPILLIFTSSTILFTVNWLMTSYSCATITTYKSVLAILVSSIVPKAVAVVGVAFSSILLT